MAIVNEVVAKRTRRQHVALYPERPFYVHGDTCVLPGMVAYRSSFSPVRIVRSRELLSDGNDNLVFSWFSQARITNYRNQEQDVGPGAATLISACDEATGIFPTVCSNAVIMVPRSTLAPLLRDVEGCLMRPMPPDSPALGLLLRYIDLIYEETTAQPAALQKAIVAHVHDLMAVLFGATRDAAEASKNRGVRAARQHVLKEYVRENLVSANLSVSQIAAQYRMTPRYVQMLFDDGDTTFTEFVRNERLARAYQMLSSPRWRDRKIVEIGLACGFNDLSHFNRAFRKRFNATPTDVRALGGK